MNNLNLPENGSVVIVDEQQSEALPIIKALSKHGIACTYYTSDVNEFPAEPMQFVRILFLDLQLQDGVSDPHQIATNLIGVVQRIIRPDNGPYLLVLWSQKISLYGSHVEAALKNIQHGVVPACVISFNKADCLEQKQLYGVANHKEFIDKILEGFTARIDEDDFRILTDRLTEQLKNNVTTYFEAKPNAFEIIDNNIQEGLAKAGVFHLFVIWENLVKRSSSQIVKQISDVIIPDDHWESNMRDVFRRMGTARIGQNNSIENQLIKESISTLNDSFLDSLNSSTKDAILPEHISLTTQIVLAINMPDNVYKLAVEDNGEKSLYIGDVRKSGPQKKIETLSNNIKSSPEKEHSTKLIDKYLSIPASVNSKLHLEFDPSNELIPGNIYLMSNPQSDSANVKFLSECFDVPDGAEQQFEFIELEVSPICDYAQVKWKKSRMITGLIYPAHYKLKQPDSKYLYSVPQAFEIEGNLMKLVFDFHLFKSLDIEIARKLGKPKYRLKREMLLDIIANLSSHVVRPGIMLVY